ICNAGIAFGTFTVNAVNSEPWNVAASVSFALVRPDTVTVRDSPDASVVALGSSTSVWLPAEPVMRNEPASELFASICQRISFPNPAGSEAFKLKPVASALPGFASVSVMAAGSPALIASAYDRSTVTNGDAASGIAGENSEVSVGVQAAPESADRA